jgi:hypothetical protein
MVKRKFRLAVFISKALLVDLDRGEQPGRRCGIALHPGTDGLSHLFYVADHLL